MVTGLALCVLAGNLLYWAEGYRDIRARNPILCYVISVVLYSLAAVCFIVAAHRLD